LTERPDASVRLKKLNIEMQKDNLDCALLFWSRNVYYFSGTSQHGCVVIPLDSEPILLVRVNFEIAKKESRIRDTRELSSIENIRDILSELGLDRARIGIEEKLIPLWLYKRLSTILPKANFCDVTHSLYELRMVKQREEIEHIERAAEFTNACHKRAREVLTDGLKENELAAEIEYAMRKAGNEGFIFHNRWGASMYHGMLASGPNIATISGYGAFTITGTGLSTAYPYGASNRRIHKGEPVVIDYVGCADGYYCDEARTYVVGKAEDKLRDIFNALKKAEENALETIKPGIPVCRIYFASRKAMKSSAYEDNFMGFGKYVGKYVGHGLGLEIDEPPVIEPSNETTIKAGMVLALEPKVIIPKYGGVALEDTVLVTKDGFKLITRTERELFETMNHS
jgi:Xaa-Pro aminopeptidase